VAASWANDDLNTLPYQVDRSNSPAFAVTCSTNVSNAVTVTQPLNYSTVQSTTTLSAYSLHYFSKIVMWWQNFKIITTHICNFCCCIFLNAVGWVRFNVPLDTIRPFWRRYFLHVWCIPNQQCQSKSVPGLYWRIMHGYPDSSQSHQADITMLYTLNKKY